MKHVRQSDLASFTNEPVVTLKELDAQLQMQAWLRERVERLELEVAALKVQVVRLEQRRIRR